MQALVDCLLCRCAPCSLEPSLPDAHALQDSQLQEVIEVDTPQRKMPAQSTANEVSSPSIEEKTEARLTKICHSVQDDMDAVCESNEEPDEAMKILFGKLLRDDPQVKKIIRDAIKRNRDTPCARKHLARALACI